MATPTTVASVMPQEPIIEVPTRSLGDAKISYDILHYIPQESAEHYKIAPLGVVEGVLEVGMVDPEDFQGIDALNFIARATGMPFKVLKISEQDFEKVLAMYRGLGGTVDQAISDMAKEEHVTDKVSATENVPLDLDDPSIGRNAGAANLNIQEDAPTIKIVSTILR